jgi:hypothetical protein
MGYDLQLQIFLGVVICFYVILVILIFDVLVSTVRETYIFEQIIFGANLISYKAGLN